jgi:hypothetical protein
LLTTGALLWLGVSQRLGLCEEIHGEEIHGEGFTPEGFTAGNSRIVNRVLPGFARDHWRFDGPIEVRGIFRRSFFEKVLASAPAG